MIVIVIYPTGTLTNGAQEPPTRLRVAPRRMQVEIEDQGNDAANLERIWRIMNRVDGSEIEYQVDLYAERSMCAGDMVEMNGETFICDTVGWKRIVPSLGLVQVHSEMQSDRTNNRD